MPDNLKEKMWKTAFEQAQKLGFKFERICESELQGRIDKAVKEMQKKKQTDRSEEALSNLKKLVEKMVDEAKSKGYTSLHEDTLFGALQNLCPIFPFC